MRKLELVFWLPSAAEQATETPAPALAYTPTRPDGCPYCSVNGLHRFSRNRNRINDARDTDITGQTDTVGFGRPQDPCSFQLLPK